MRDGRRGRIVVLRALGLGDLCTAIPALRAIRRAHPHDVVELLMPATLAGFVRLFDDGPRPLVDTVIDHRGLAPLPAGLAHPDLAINLHGRGPQSHARLAALEPASLIGFSGPGDAGAPAWMENEHDRDRWVRLLARFGMAGDPADLHAEPRALTAPAGTAGATLLHPGAASPARRWPEDRWAAVARTASAWGRPVAILAGPGETTLARRIAAAARLPPDASVVQPTALGLAGALRACALLICGDTGPAHLASALRTRSVLLFGPSDPARWGPPVDGRHRVLWAGRTGDPHANVPDAGLLEITVDDVIAAMASLRRPARWAS